MVCWFCLCLFNGEAHWQVRAQTSSPIEEHGNLAKDARWSPYFGVFFAKWREGIFSRVPLAFLTSWKCLMKHIYSYLSDALRAFVNKTLKITCLSPRLTGSQNGFWIVTGTIVIPTIGVLSTSIPMAKISNLKLVMIQMFVLAGHPFGYVSHFTILYFITHNWCHP
jgi:hypothetical protein